MYNADRSASGRTRMLKANTLATYHIRNPTKNDYGGEKPSSALTLLLRSVGSNELCGKCVTCEPVCDLSNAYIAPFSQSDIPDVESFLFDITGQTITVPLPPDGYPEDRAAIFLFFPEICNTTSYVGKVYNPGLISVTQHFLGVYNTTFLFAHTGFIIIYPSEELSELTVTLTASNECSESITTASLGFS
jgi:hypothetical protein